MLSGFSSKYNTIYMICKSKMRKFINGRVKKGDIELASFERQSYPSQTT